MEKYKIKINGNVYDVEVELSNESTVENSMSATSSAAATSTGSSAVSAPMPGTILSVNVSVGQSVKKGDVLFILEAMKMENEIVSPADGKIASVSVKKGDAVSTGNALCTLS